MYPLEVVLQGTPISHQSKNPINRNAWKQRVNEAALKRRKETYELGFLDVRPLAVTIFYFPGNPMEGDIDNIVKPIMDAMIGVAYIDDKAVERVAVQKFEPECVREFLSPTAQLTIALDTAPPVVYIQVNDDLSWRMVR